jgi:hypothetical protein
MELQQSYNFEPPWKFENLFHGHKRGGSSNSFHHPFIIPSNLVKLKIAEEVGSGSVTHSLSDITVLWHHHSLTSSLSDIIAL